MRVKAIKNAQTKALELVRALDQKLGQVLEIKETNNQVIYPHPGRTQGLATRAYAESSTPTVAVEKIKINYEIFVKFEIE